VDHPEVARAEEVARRSAVGGGKRGGGVDSVAERAAPARADGEVKRVEGVVLRSEERLALAVGRLLLEEGLRPGMAEGVQGLEGGEEVLRLRRGVGDSDGGAGSGSGGGVCGGGRLQVGSLRRRPAGLAAPPPQARLQLLIAVVAWDLKQ